MADTGDIANSSIRPPVDPAFDNSATAMQAFRMALGLYALWAGLIWASVSFGQTILPHKAIMVLLAGITATNVLFWLMARASSIHRPPPSTMTLAQCVFGITWATLFSFLSTGPGELTLSVYISILLFAMLRVSPNSLLQLITFSSASYAIVVLLNGVLNAPGEPLGPEFLKVLLLAAISGWLLLYGRHLSDLRSQLTARNEQLLTLLGTNPQLQELGAEREYHSKSLNRAYLLDSLTREKGRTDRSNLPFSICVFDVDQFSAMREEHGALVCDRVLKKFAESVRKQLRAMDGISPAGDRRSFGRFSEAQYIVILPQTNLAGAVRCAERIRQANEDQPIDGKYAITVSGGAVEYQRGETIAALLERTDDALERARAGGGNQIDGRESKQALRADVIQLHEYKR